MKAYKVTVHKKENEQDIYSLTYKEGEITEAIEGTVGAFCFDSYAAAKKFAIDCVDCLTKNVSISILEVEGLSTPLYPKMISYYSSESDLDKFYKNIDCLNNTSVISGTVCYRELRSVREMIFR